MAGPQDARGPKAVAKFLRPRSVAIVARLLPILDRFKLTRGCGFVDLADCWECLRGTKDLAKVREAAEKRPGPSFVGR